MEGFPYSAGAGKLRDNVWVALLPVPTPSWSRIKKSLGQKSGLFIKETIRAGRGEESGGAPRHVGPGSDDSTCLKTWGKDQLYCWNGVLEGGGDSCKLLSVALPSLRHLPALLTVESSEERRFEEWGRVLGCQNLCSHFIPKLTAPAHTHTICLLQPFDFFPYFGSRGVTLLQNNNRSPSSQLLVLTQCLAFL